MNLSTPVLYPMHSGQIKLIGVFVSFMDSFILLKKSKKADLSLFHLCPLFCCHGTPFYT